MSKLLPLLFLLTAAGCEAHVEVVAKGGLLQKVDSTLDDLDRRREEIGRSVAALRDRLAEVRKAKIKVQVQSDLLTRKIDGVQARIGDLDSSLTSSRPSPTPETSVEIGQPLGSPTGREVQRREDLSGQLHGLEEARGRLLKATETLEQRQWEIERKLAAFLSQIAIIDAHQIALKAMKRAAEALESTGNEMTDLEEKLGDLEAEVRAELAVEQARIDDVFLDNDGGRR